MSGSTDNEYTSESKCHLRTRLIHGIGQSKRWDYDHHVLPPVTSSAAFRLDSSARGARGFSEFAHWPAEGPPPPPIYVYDRMDEPTRAMLEETLARAEEGDFALCFASGMGAISAALCTMLRRGDQIIAHRVLYGCTYSLLTNWLGRYGIDVRLADLVDHKALRAAIKPETRVIYFETPVNPNLTLIDIGAIRRVVDEVNSQRPEVQQVRIVVDNTFATPFCQRPLSLGADVVCTSLTKGIGGFGTDIGGAVIGPRWLHDPLMLYRKDFGGSLAPKNAWNFYVYGLPSLATRMTNYQKTAYRVAKFLEEHPKVESVRYPGLESFPQHELANRQMRDERGNFAPGSMLYFLLKEPDGDGKAAERLVNYLADNAYCITLAVSLGQIKTLIECPYSMTHAAMPGEVKRERGMDPGGVRLSIGLEDWEDLVADLTAALEQV